MRFENRTWTLIRDGDHWTFDAWDPISDEALAALSGNARSWAHSLLIGLDDVTARGWIRTVDEAVEVAVTARRLRSKLSLTATNRQAVLVVSSFDDDRNVRARVAEAAHTPRDVLARLVSDVDRKVQRAALRNSHLVPGDVNVAALDRDVLTDLLANTADTDLIGQFLNDRRVTVRRAVAENPCAPPRWLAEVVQGNDVLASEFAARNPSLRHDDGDRLLGWCINEGVEKMMRLMLALVRGGHGSAWTLHRLVAAGVEAGEATALPVARVVLTEERASPDTRAWCRDIVADR